LRKAIGLSWKMLDFSGRGLMRTERVDLETWLPSFLATVHPNLPATFKLDLRCEPVPFIKADRSKLEQVLKAVLDNALEAAGPQGGAVRVRLRVDFGEDRSGPGSPGVWPLERPEFPATVCLEIADDGPGVPAGNLGLICDPFYTTQELGRGLGLAAAVGILSAHRAGLHLLNGPEKGLILRMHFPPGGA
jgi:signal transduction histidine kinase